MKNFKGYLTEGATTASTLFELVIVFCVNNSSKSKDDFIAAFEADANSQKWVNTAGKSKFAVDSDSVYQFAQLLKKKTKGSNATSAGQSSPATTEFWKTHTGKGKDTSKADVLIDSHRVSIKGPDARLMSGVKEESLATLYAAFETIGVENIGLELEEIINGFVSRVKTIGDTMTSRALKKQDPKKLSAENKKAFKELETQVNIKKQAEAAFKKAFNNKEFADAFAWEAMSGEQKFGDTEGMADSMLVWDYDLKSLVWHSNLTLSNPYVKKVSSKMKFSADVKSNSYDKKGKKYGYSISQTVALAMKTVKKDFESGINECVDSYNQLHNQLNEGVINEVALTALLKKVWAKLKNVIKKAWNKLLNLISKINTQIKDAITGGMPDMLNAFELQPSIKTNL